MKVQTALPGGFCQSLQGRDKNRFYIIKEVAGDFVYVADGNYKKLSAPKKKRIKHIKLLPLRAEAIGLKLERGEKVFDTEIYSALRQLTEVKTEN